jgi:hypothetical protein
MVIHVIQNFQHSNAGSNARTVGTEPQYFRHGHGGEIKEETANLLRRERTTTLRAFSIAPIETAE